MKQKRFYVDACIFLNLWKKEGNERFGKPYWRIAEEFFEKYKDNKFYYSGILLREISFSLPKKEFKEITKGFHESNNYKKLFFSSEIKRIARKIESEINFEISFYDIIHMLFALKTNSILITRDKKLIETAKKYKVKANKPEELLFP